MARTPKPKSSELAHITPDLRKLAVHVDKLKPDAHNPKLHPERNRTALEYSLSRFGQREPIVANAHTGVVESGNCRLEIAKALGWQYVAVVWVEDDPDTASGYAIAANRTGELGAWDGAVLAGLIMTLSLEDSGISEYLGFTSAELELLCGKGPLDTLPELGSGTEKEVSFTASDKPRTWTVYVECEDEQHKDRVLAALQAAGFKGKATR